MEYREYNGYSLFSDVEDYQLRTRNRGVVMVNILQDEMQHCKVTDNAMRLVKEYFSYVPEDERKDVIEAFEHELQARGYNA